MTHAFTANNGTRHFHPALLADNPLIANASVLPAITLIVAVWPENALVKEAVLFASLGTIVDRFRLRYLAEGPFFDVIRRRELDEHAVKIVYV
jgi:hypothetical protein